VVVIVWLSATPTVTLPKVAPANVGLAVVATLCPMLTNTLPVVGLTVTPVPPLTLYTLLLTIPDVKSVVLLYRLVLLLEDTVPDDIIVPYLMLY
jgi:hypothetical protein